MLHQSNTLLPMTRRHYRTSIGWLRTCFYRRSPSNQCYNSTAHTPYCSSWHWQYCTLATQPNLVKYASLPSVSSTSNLHNKPVHDLLSEASLNPGLQLSHFDAPSLEHFAPDDPTPLAHEHWLASHLLLSSLTFHPVLQLDSSHPLL